MKAIQILVSDPLFEEMLEDIKQLTASMVRFGSRWTTIGEVFENASDSQKQEIHEVMAEFIAEVHKIK